MPKLIGLAAATVILLAGTATAAVANDTPIISEHPGGVQVGARSSERSGTTAAGDRAGHGGRHDSATSVSCDFTPTDGPGLAFTASCSGQAATRVPTIIDLQFITPTPAQPTASRSRTIVSRPTVTPAMLAQQAYHFLPLPAPEIHTNPPANREQLVELPTWLWVSRASWGTRTATASIPTLSVTVTAVPVAVTWTMGDGGRVACDGQGTPFDPAHPTRQPSCAYAYRRSSAGQPAGRFTVTATTTWNITWTASGSVTGGGTLPPLARSAQTTLAVAEVQAINTSNM